MGPQEVGHRELWQQDLRQETEGVDREGVPRASASTARHHRIVSRWSVDPALRNPYDGGAAWKLCQKKQTLYNHDGNTCSPFAPKGTASSRTIASIETPAPPYTCTQPSDLR